MNNKKLLGKRIKEIRKKAGYTQEKLAEVINLDVTTLSGIESGRHFPSLVSLEKIAQTLNTAFISFFDFDNNIPIEEMKSIILNNINLFSDDDIKFIYKLLNKKYFQEFLN